MTFLNTGLLWGLALASIPVIIHLIRKNKVIEVEWAAMDFLMDIVEEQKKRFQMEDLLLLLLRVGVILFLVLALARPVIKSALGIGDTNTVLSIDDTYSMATVSGTQNRFNRASEAADAILGKMSGEGGSALVLHRANAKKIISSFSSDGDLMNETVSQLDVSDYHSNGPDGLKACLEILEKEKPASASVYFISDFQKAEWEEPSLEVMDIVKKLREKAEVIFVNAGDTEVDNLSVEEIRSLQDAVKVEETAWFAAKIRNHGQEDAGDVQIQFLLDGDIKESISVSVPAEQTTSLVFKTEVEAAGFHSATVQISADNNQRDNAGHVHFKVHDKLQVLVVQNHLPDQLEDKRSLYWDFALNPFPGASQSDKALYKFTWATTDALSTEDLNNYAFVIMDDVQAITTTEASFVEEYVANGGGLLVNLGPSVDIENYNSNLYKEGNGILSWQLMDTAIEEKVKGRYLNIEAVNVSHDIWSFSEKPKEVQGFKLKKTYGFLSQNSDRAFSLMKLSTEGDDRSIMASFNYKKGRAIVLGTTSGMEWNNMALLPVYLPFCRKISGWLMEQKVGQRALQVGSEIFEELPSDKARAEFEMISPSGNKQIVDVDTSGDKPHLNIQNLNEAGIYQLRESGTQKSRLISVNVNSSESDIASMSNDELEQKFADLGVQVTDTAGVSTVKSTGGASEISKLLLLLAALCWLGENILAYTISRKGAV